MMDLWRFARRFIAKMRDTAEHVEHEIPISLYFIHKKHIPHNHHFLKQKFT